MITILSSPKPFKGNDKLNQYRAIESWKNVPNSEIMLFGNSEGINQAGNDLNVKVVNNIKQTDEGLPYFNSIIDYANRYGLFGIQMYINCDIVIDNIETALQFITFKKFLLIGERLDLSKDIFIDIIDKGYKKKLINKLDNNQVKMHGPTGIDYFIFPKGIWDTLPEIIVGRGAYDSALLAHCKRNGIPLIDASLVIIALHQFHDYNHVKKGKNEVFYGNNAKENKKAAGGIFSSNWISDSDYILNNDGLHYWPFRGQKLRNLEITFRHNYQLKYLAIIIRMMRKLFNKGNPLSPPLLNKKKFINALKRN